MQPNSPSHFTHHTLAIERIHIVDHYDRLLHVVNKMIISFRLYLMLDLM